MCVDAPWQQRLHTVCNFGILCVLSTTANLQSYSNTCCVAERAQGAPALSRCPTFYPWTTQAPLPSEPTRAAAAAAASMSSSLFLNVRFSRECLTSALAAARNCQQITLLQPSFISHVVPMCISSKSRYPVLYRTICENGNIDSANNARSRIKCTF